MTRKEFNLADMYQLVICKSPDIVICNDKDFGRLKNDNEIISDVVEKSSN